MATLLSICGTDIHRLDPGLEAGELEARVLFGTTDFTRWVKDVLPSLVSERRLDLTPLDQFDAMSVDYCTGQELIVGPDFHALLPRQNGVWEFKSPDLRIFGWFPQRDHFIAVVGHLADRVKHHEGYGRFIRQVVAFRDALTLDDPKFLPGDDPNVVISNCRYP